VRPDVVPASVLIVLEGLAIGFVVAVPVGPVGLLTIRQSLHHGRLTGFVTGLGAATADAIFGFIAAIGLTAVVAFLARHQTPLQLLGGAMMLALGVQAMRTRPPSATHAAEPPDLRTAYVSTVALTLTNPMTILGFIALFTGLKVHPSGLPHVLVLTAGIFLGSTAWWLVLSSIAGWLGEKLDSARLRCINFAAGFAIAAFGVWQLLRLAL